MIEGVTPEEALSLAAAGEGIYGRQAREGFPKAVVNDVWGGDALMEWGVPFWKLDTKKGRTMLERAIWAHLQPDMQDEARRIADLLDIRFLRPA